MADKWHIEMIMKNDRQQKRSFMSFDDDELNELTSSIRNIKLKKDKI